MVTLREWSVVRGRTVETLYTYKRVRRPDGTETYERVRYDPNEPTLEPPVLVPQHAPMFKNGEVPGAGSVVVDLMLAKAEAAEARRQLRDALDAQAEADRINARLGRAPKPKEPQRAARPYGRVLEP